MASLYGFLVGIDRYQRPVPGLSGCRDDIDRAGQYLESLGESRLTVKLKRLVDREATRSAVIQGFREHLAQAGPQDTALFWFSGHGSRAPVPARLWHREPTGHLQTLVCYDSRRHGVPDLYDKELAVLLDAVAESGAHVVTVLDCCYSGGATRDGGLADRPLNVRVAPALKEPPSLDSMLPELRRDADLGGSVRAPRTRPVSLAACTSTQLAYEISVGGATRGAFTTGLLHALRTLGTDATYRELMTAARCYVETFYPNQMPVLYPHGSPQANRPFLGGSARPPVSPMTMRYIAPHWEIDAGACHGMIICDGEEARVGVPGSEPLQEARVGVVQAHRSRVVPLAWEPDRRRQYPVVVTRVPLPAITVSIGGAASDDDDTAEHLTAELGTCGPGGGPSPHVRVIGSRIVGEIHVATPRPGEATITGADGCDYSTPARGPDARAVRDLEHIARWRQVKTLANPVSRLGNAVRIEVVAAYPQDHAAPRDRLSLVPDQTGAIQLRYAANGAGWTSPVVFVRLRNRTDRDLYCALLDLTDRYRIHTTLFTGDLVPAGAVVAAAEGEAIALSLPAGRAITPGAVSRDWLKVLVSEAPFNSEPFALPQLGGRMPAQSRGTAAFATVLEQLGHAAVHRDADRRSTGAHDWTTGIVPIVTSVPGREPA